MEILLWILQIFLAITFLYSGVMKSTQDREKLVSIGQTGVDGLSYPVIRSIGIAEILGAIGITVPEALSVLPVFTPVVALCFVLIMILAAPIHYKRREYRSVLLNMFLLIISLLVAYVRFCQLTGHPGTLKSDGSSLILSAVIPCIK